MPVDSGQLSRALDDALAARIHFLFGSLCVAPNLDEGLQKFEVEVTTALEAYDLVRPHLLRMV
jgi:hypothetical protein